MSNDAEDTYADTDVVGNSAYLAILAPSSPFLSTLLVDHPQYTSATFVVFHALPEGVVTSEGYRAVDEGSRHVGGFASMHHS